MKPNPTIAHGLRDRRQPITSAQATLEKFAAQPSRVAAPLTPRELGLVERRELAAALNTSVVRLKRLEVTARFPKSLQMGRQVYYRLADVAEWARLQVEAT